MANFTEEQLYKALGVGAKAQEVADPVTQDPTVETQPDAGAAGGQEGAEAQEIAAPAQEETAPASGAQTEPTAEEADPEDPENSADTSTDANKQPQTPEERKANAARRRQQEQQAAIDAALAVEREQHAKVLEDIFARAGLKNTSTGQPIRTMEEFDTWEKEVGAAQLQAKLREGKLTPEDLNNLISNHPTVKRAEQMVQASETVMKKMDDTRMQDEVNRQIAEISKMNPAIQSVSDLVKLPNFKEFQALVNKGNDFLSAYKLLTYDENAARKAEAAKQQALNNTRGKDHLQATGNSRGAGSAPVPAEDMRMYRAFNPNATDEQIRAHFNKQKK